MSLTSVRKKSTCVVNAASSTGRCNTTPCVDLAMRPRESHLFGRTRSKRSQGGVAVGLALASVFSFCFNARWVRASYCLDPLRPPHLPDKSRPPLGKTVKAQKRGNHEAKYSDNRPVVPNKWSLERDRIFAFEYLPVGSRH